MSPVARHVVVVGASAAGLRCACRLARLEPRTDITVIEAGTAISTAACGLPYVLSGDVGEIDALRRTADGSLRDEAYFARVKGVRVLTGTRAERVDAAARTLWVRDGSGNGRPVAFDELVLATGARPRRLPGQVDHPRLRTVHTIADVSPLQRGLADGSITRIAVIGAGPLGCELAESFRALWGAEVVLLEAAGHPLPALLDAEPAAIVAAALEHEGVTLRCGQAVARVEPTDRSVRIAVDGEPVECDIAVAAIGVVPAVELAVSAGVSLGPTGAIAVDGRLATSVPHIWAAGDCIEVRNGVTGKPDYLPLGSLANRQGRTLANVLAGRDDTFGPVVGAAAVKVFDCNVAAAGCTLATAARLGREARAVWITAHDRAHYWPGARDIALQVAYVPSSHEVLGVQAVGAGEVAKRIDVAAEVLRHRGTLADLANVEHAYAPPYAPALDPLAVAAMVAADQEDGVEGQPPNVGFENRRMLDVRHVGERDARPLHAAAVDVVDLVDLAGSGYAADPTTLVVCERGGRSAEAARRLGARYLGGGLRWRDGLGWGGRR